MTTDSKNCARPGCSKKLRANNTTGSCATGCLSPEAPPGKRATGATVRAARGEAPKRVPTQGVALDRFRVVCEALGMDPDEVLTEFAEGWLDALKERLK